MTNYTVGEFTKYLKSIFDKTFPETVSITGEVSNLSRASSGHIYFTLKDNSAQLKAAFFRNYASSAGAFIPKNGDKVKAVGDISLYSTDGTYQIIVKRVFYDSEGDFWKKFEATKRKLEQEGLFDESRKKQIPKFARRVALITSATGAAIKDFFVTAVNDGGKFLIDLWNVPVQGAEATVKIAAAINQAGAMTHVYDVLIIMRGGGSLDDLSVFNEEVIARATVASAVPTISAIGHERDFTVIDFAADKRSATPTAAAALISAAYKKANMDLIGLTDTIGKVVFNKIANLNQRVDFLELKVLASSPKKLLENYKNKINMAEKSVVFHTKNLLSYYSLSVNKVSNILEKHNPLRLCEQIKYKISTMEARCLERVKFKLEKFSGRLRIIEGKLALLNPENVLERGYAIVSKDGAAIGTISKLKIKDSIEIKMKDGYANSLIIDCQNNGKNPLDFPA